MGDLIFYEERTVTADVTVEFDHHDLSNRPLLAGFVTMTATATGGGSTLDVYLESRDLSGQWVQRWHSAQFAVGDLAGVTSMLDALMQQPAYGAATQSGLASATLSAGGIRNGHFPGPYTLDVDPPVNNRQAASWRVRYDLTGTGSYALKTGFYAPSPFAAIE